MPLPLIYQDEHMVIVNKPSGLLVHRTALDPLAQEFALQMLRDQLGRHVYPVHRLDRATSGALIFALSSEMAQEMTVLFSQGEIAKTYLALVRGVLREEIKLDYPLKEILDKKTDGKAQKNKPAQQAITAFKTLKSCEFPVKVDKYPTSSYSLLQVNPQTGRKHQIRRHLHHLSHPIIGDTTYGKSKHNHFFAEKFKIKRLLLACTDLAFTHPKSKKFIHVQAPLAEDYQNLLNEIEWKKM